jgi:iron complex outermembrane receptor protein
MTDRCSSTLAMMAKRYLSLCCLGALCLPAYGADDLADLSIDQLLNIEITTASKKEQKLSETPAAAFVLTHDDIMRSSATTLPELLLTVPGVEGGAINSHSAAIGIRGLGGQWSNKLVVLIDGRSVFTRTFSGIYWDSYNIPFEDIERIEVIRGANAALWGANAVNGVINIITRNSGATQGTLLRGSAGTNASGDLLARQGFQIGERGFARVYTSGENHGDSAGHPKGEAEDAWDGSRAGFRGDWDSTTGTRLMAEADVYRLNTDNNPFGPGQLPPNSFLTGATVEPTSTSHGHSLLLNLTQAYALTSEWSLQFAWSRADRDEFVPLLEDNYDFDFQHHFQPWEGHDLVWGANVRYRRDDTGSTAALRFDPADAEDTNSSLFFQDEIALAGGRVLTTIGSRLEYDQHNQWVPQPSLRVLWNLSSAQKLWGAISRAARTPSRVDRDLAADFPAVFNVAPYGPLPMTLQLRGDPDFKTEEMLSYELGYRLQPVDSVSIDLALYWNRYDNLRAVEYNGNFTLTPDGKIFAQMPFGNSMDGKVYGGELVTSWAPTSTLRLMAFWSEVRLDIHSNPIAETGFNFARESNNSSPTHQVGVRTDWDFANHWSAQLQLKYVAEMDQPYNSALLEDHKIPAYLDCDLNLGWQVTSQWRLALLGKNLLDSSRLEYSSEAGANPTEARRAGYIRATWKF